MGLCRSYPQSEEAIVEGRRTEFISSHSLKERPTDNELMPEGRHCLLNMEDKLSRDDGISTDDGSSWTQVSASLATEIGSGAEGKDVWSQCFKPRAVEEATRNCAHVEESIKSVVVASITSSLLALPPCWVSLSSQCQAHPQTTPVMGAGMGMSQVGGIESEDLCGDVVCTCGKKTLWNRGGQTQCTRSHSYVSWWTDSHTCIVWLGILSSCFSGLVSGIF